MKRFFQNFRVLFGILFFINFLLVIFVNQSLVRAESSTYDDPFYNQKGTDNPMSKTTSSFQQVSESVDPFTGNLNLIHTDAILPGNGGFGFKNTAVL
ncbi:MAG: hypothetical protein HY202_01785 [Nitrospirae bacterium]|nr:hypothetical protein [Nitrospirota bacterium]